jgi:hypothetical protein
MLGGLGSAFADVKVLQRAFADVKVLQLAACCQG